jgi:hypothetical protein
MLAATPARPRRPPLLRRRVILAVLVFCATWWAAHARWGIEKALFLRTYPEPPACVVHVINRTSGPVCFRATDGQGVTWRVLTLSRQRSVMEFQSGAGSPPVIPMEVLALSLDAPGVRTISVDWSAESEPPAWVIITANGSTRFEPPRAPRKESEAFTGFDSEYELPVKADVDFTPGRSPVSIASERGRDRETWLTGPFNMGPSGDGTFARAGHPLPITCRIPAVTRSARVELPAAPTGIHIVEVAADGTVTAEPWTMGDRILFDLGF